MERVSHAQRVITRTKPKLRGLVSYASTASTSLMKGLWGVLSAFQECQIRRVISVPRRAVLANIPRCQLPLFMLAMMFQTIHAGNVQAVASLL